MVAKRRVGSETSETRGEILDATERLMAEQGYAAVTSRAVAAVVGINPGLVHYYFPSLDDLFVAVVRRGAERSSARMVAAIASPEPLRRLWEISVDPQAVKLLTEVMAAANHRDDVRAEVTELARQNRRTQIEALRELIPQYDLDGSRFPPSLLAAAIQGTALLVGREAALGVGSDHAEAAAAIEALLDELEARRRDKLGTRAAGT